MVDGPIDAEAGLSEEHEVDLQPIALEDTLAELNEVAAERDELRVRVEALESEMYQVAMELDKHGAPPAGSLNARVRSLVHLHTRQIEEVVQRAGDDVATARASTFRKLPAERDSKTRKIAIGPDHDLYITVGLYEDGTPGEIFLKMAKQGSMLSGLMDSFAIMLSLGLKHGVPVEKIVRKLSNLRFEPSGFTGAADIPHVESPVDAVAKFLAARFLRKVDEEVKP